MPLLISIIKGRLHRAGQIKKALDTELDTIKKKLLYLFSHEFRTPLTHIKGVSDILTDESVNFDEDSLKKFYQILKDGTDRLQILMEEFLTVARIEASYATGRRISSAHHSIYRVSWTRSNCSLWIG